MVDDDVFSVAGIAKVGDGHDLASCGGNDGVAQIIGAIEVDRVCRAVIGSRRSGPYLAASERHLEIGCCVRCAGDCTKHGYGEQIAEYFDYFHLFLHFFSLQG
jgi:hypothetical protein